jgi:hypothetical protein
VTDLGVKYLVPTSAALTDLGFTAADERALPAALMAMLPTGPSLDPVAAASGGEEKLPSCADSQQPGRLGTSPMGRGPQSDGKGAK